MCNHAMSSHNAAQNIFCLTCHSCRSSCPPARPAEPGRGGYGSRVRGGQGYAERRIYDAVDARETRSLKNRVADARKCCGPNREAK
jgi:hypothetical protein